MPERYVPWEEIKKDWSDKYPDSFWLRVQNEHPEGMQISIAEKQKPTPQQLQTALNVWFSWHKKNPVGAQGYAPRPGIAGWQDASRGYASLYLSWLKDDIQSYVVAGEATQEEATADFARISAQVTQMGLHPGLPGIGAKDSGIWSQWSDFLGRYAEEVNLPSGGRVYSLGGYYYNPDATKVPASEQEYLRNIVEQQEQMAKQAIDAQKQAMIATAEGKAAESKSWKSYFDLNKQWEEMATGRTIKMREDAHDDNDVVIARGPYEARQLGYTSYIPENEFSNPKVKATYESKYIENLRTMATRIIGAKMIPGEKYPNVWDAISKLTPAEHEQAKQMALAEAIQLTGGERPAGIRIKSERSPLSGPSIVSPEEYKAMRDKKKSSKSEMAEIRALGAIEKYKKEKLLQSYQQFALGGEAPEVTKGMSGEALAEYQRKQRLWGETPEFYELPGEKTPEWMPQYVPGLTAGQPLRLGHQVATPSGQGWRNVTPSQRQYLQSYMATSEQVTPGYTPRRTYEDIMHEMGIGKSKTVTGARGWRVSRQRT